MITHRTIDGVDVVEKRLSPRERTEPEAIARLHGEAVLLRVLGGIATPVLVDAGDDAEGPWLRTRAIATPTFSARFADANGTPLADGFVARAARAIFEAAAIVHEATDERGPLAIVHADPSPANVFVDDAGTRATLIDFDLATWRDGPPRDGAFRGTIAYVAPEVARGEAPTVRSDLFALAAVVLHAMTGRVPREGASFPALLARAAEEPLLPQLEALELTRLSAKGPVERAILACLAHEPSDRPRSARDVLAAMVAAEREC